MAHDLDRRERGWLDRRRPAVKIAAAAATAGLVALLARPITIGDVTVRLQMTAPLVSVQYARHQVIVDGSSAAGGSSVTVLFQCDWPTLGDETDCGATDWSTGDPADLDVVVASDSGLSANWPNDRALAVYCNRRGDDGCNAALLAANQIWSLPSPGDVYAYRVTVTSPSGPYLSTGNLGSDEHAYSTTTGGQAFATVVLGATQGSAVDSFSIGFNQIFVDAPDHRFCVSNGTSGGCGGGEKRWWPGSFEMEWHHRIEFVSDTSYIADARVYDVVGDSLLYDGADFVNNNGTSNLPSGTLILSSSDPWNWDHLRIGSSAINPSELNSSTFQYGTIMLYYGGLAVCKGDWCPRYGGLPGEG